MEPPFSEEVFLVALTQRPEDAKRYASTFRSEYLINKQYSEILSQIYEFTVKYGVPPSLTTLHSLIKDKDKNLYDLHYRAALTKLEQVNPELDQILYTLDKARDVAIIRSFQTLVQDESVLSLEEGTEGQELINRISSWMNQFDSSGHTETLTIKEAIDKLISDTGFNYKNIRYETGLIPIDRCMKGGIRPGNLAIMMAPTAGGKSTVLMNIAYNVAKSYDDANVWFISNELDMVEQTSRFLSRITGVSMDLIDEDPIAGYSDLDREWSFGLDKRLTLTTSFEDSELSTLDLESMLTRRMNLTGTKPNVIVLDFMERMKPSNKGYRRDKEWQWLGAIAKDLVRLAKRHKILIWTACQTNRPGLDAAEISLTHGQSSIRHFQEAAFVMVFSKRKHPESNGKDGKVILKMVAKKARHAALQEIPFYVEANLNTMMITNKLIDIKETKRTEAPNPPQKKSKSKRPAYEGV